VDTAIIHLLNIFKKDNDQHVICLMSRNKEIGCFTKADLFRLHLPDIDDQARLIFSSHDEYPSSRLPGVTVYRRYKCPYAYQSCSQYMDIISDTVDRVQIPKCNNPQHPGLDMIPE
jgi:hypothetical protein